MEKIIKTETFFFSNIMEETIIIIIILYIYIYIYFLRRRGGDN